MIIYEPLYRGSFLCRKQIEKRHCEVKLLSVDPTLGVHLIRAAAYIIRSLLCHSVEVDTLKKVTEFFFSFIAQYRNTEIDLIE